MKKENTTTAKLCKVVYFDEGSVADFVQIIEDGEFEKTVETLSKTLDEVSGGTGLTGKLGISGIFKALIGNEATVSAEAKASAEYNSERMAKTILKNTLLTDFIGVIEKTPNGIVKFENYDIDAPKDSLSYIALISPYFSMINNGNVPAGDFSIAIEKLDNTLRNAKGYYEFVGTKKIQSDVSSNKTVIFRFNIDAFKNNYKVTDLLRMNLVIYAVKVGKSSLDKLSFQGEFDYITPLHDNPSYDGSISSDNLNQEDEIDVYDVLLAGVGME